MRTFFALIATACVVSCSQQELDAREDKRRQNDLSTVEHDGHKFIAYYHECLVHHPDCPCLKR